MRKKFESVLHWLLPKTWIPLYTMVAFTRIPYHICLEREERQDKILGYGLRTLLVGGVALGGYLLARMGGVSMSMPQITLGAPRAMLAFRD